MPRIHKPTPNERGEDGGYTASELERRHRANALQAHVVCRCAKCDWATEGPNEECQKAFREHHRKKHGPVPKQPVRMANRRFSTQRWEEASA